MWFTECPWCGIEIPLAEQKDFESFTFSEVSKHLYDAHRERWDKWEIEHPYAIPYTRARQR